MVMEYEIPAVISIRPWLSAVIGNVLELTYLFTAQVIGVRCYRCVCVAALVCITTGVQYGQKLHNTVTPDSYFLLKWETLFLTY